MQTLLRRALAREKMVVIVSLAWGALAFLIVFCLGNLAHQLRVVRSGPVPLGFAGFWFFYAGFGVWAFATAVNAIWLATMLARRFVRERLLLARRGSAP